MLAGGSEGWLVLVTPSVASELYIWESESSQTSSRTRPVTYEKAPLRSVTGTGCLQNAGAVNARDSKREPARSSKLWARIVHFGPSPTLEVNHGSSSGQDGVNHRAFMKSGRNDLVSV